MQCFCIEVGYVYGVKFGNIVGVIVNEVNINLKYIGVIEIYDNFSIVDLFDGMLKEICDIFLGICVVGQ